MHVRDPLYSNVKPVVCKISNDQMFFTSIWAFRFNFIYMYKFWLICTFIWWLFATNTKHLSMLIMTAIATYTHLNKYLNKYFGTIIRCFGTNNLFGNLNSCLFFYSVSWKRDYTSFIFIGLSCFSKL